MIQKTKPFKAVSMPCTKKQFEKELKLILKFLGMDLVEIHFIGAKEILVNNFSNSECSVANLSITNKYSNNRQYYPKFCPKTFIEALGYDYKSVLRAMQPKISTGLTTEQFKTLSDSVVNKQTHYKVLRPILFFAKDNVVHKETLKKYFTKKAIKAFIKDKYIK